MPWRAEKYCLFGIDSAVRRYENELFQFVLNFFKKILKFPAVMSLQLSRKKFSAFLKFFRYHPKVLQQRAVTGSGSG
jgi:hypothetical protein